MVRKTNINILKGHNCFMTERPEAQKTSQSICDEN